MLTADYRSPEVTRPIPVAVDGTGAAELARALERNGFAVAALPPELAPEQALELLSERLGLGEPYVPELYRLPETRAAYGKPYVRIQRDDKDPHPGFTTTSGQRMHVDGLIDPIGKIKITALYCVRPAARGGATVVFNAIASFAELRENDPEAAEALLHPEALTRRATIPGVQIARTGPIFADAGGELTTRYSVFDHDEWQAAPGMEDALERAAKHLGEDAAADGERRVSIVLAPHQVLLSRNDRVSHGREPYDDAGDAPRAMVRALYTQAPR
ncbi:TauD/TfdA family dioxygenase [Crossiella equi]|nr:TauD/TfdA family dioxygenase [Crossiella equi]